MRRRRPGPWNHLFQATGTVHHSFMTQREVGADEAIPGGVDVRNWEEKEALEHLTT